MRIEIETLLLVVVIVCALVCITAISYMVYASQTQYAADSSCVVVAEGAELTPNVEFLKWLEKEGII
jgi:hypothetical protein